jgi:hypothetical protein
MPKVMKDRTLSTRARLKEESPKLKTPEEEFIYSNNPLTPELNPSAQRCLPRFFNGILIFKGLAVRRLYKPFGVKGLICVTSNDKMQGAT